ncbi:nucleotidyltransferase [Dissulfurispira thermophila]|uniref:Nucleotidyltransferase n=2 Tax=root TaxID=1 RepID=A0A7G1H4H5_9BACT|nr:nucleotidyltransferase domain-containing protein [Dissulfurispira thermophila]BCB97109.1 nucleotidyltransferase [Dissulfurispira thermophila]
MNEQVVKELSEKLDGIFYRIREVEFAYLFGSFARGDEFSFSDIDIAVYLNKEVSLADELRLYSIIARELKHDSIDLLILNNTHNIILLEDIVRYGKVVCDRNPFLRESFELRILHDAIDFRYQRKVFAGR